MRLLLLKEAFDLIGNAAFQNRLGIRLPEIAVYQLVVKLILRKESHVLMCLLSEYDRRLEAVSLAQSSGLMAEGYISYIFQLFVEPLLGCGQMCREDISLSDGRIARDKVVSYMYVGGHRLTVPYIFSATVIAVLTYLLSAYVIPPANIARIEYTNKWVNNKEVLYGDNIQLQVKPGVMAYLARYDKVTGSGYRFSLEQFDGNTITSRLTAETVRYDSAGLWTLNNYTIRRFDGLKETKIGGAHIDTMLNVEPRDFLISHNDEQTLTSPQLREYILKQKDRGVANIKNFEIEYERRYAMTAAAFILTIIGLSLSSRKVRGGMGMNIGIGLLLSFSYILFMTVTSTFCVSGYTSARVAMWIPNIIYTFIAAFLYARASR